MILCGAATMGCGLATSYGELALARFLVGAGEAVLAPAAYSLLADSFASATCGWRYRSLRAQRRAQSLLRQRNLLAIASAVLATVAISAAVTRDREVVLVPTVRTPLTLTSRSVPRDYLELVTRDTALMLLNRSPEGLDYWMETILGLAHPNAHGALKAQLVWIMTERRGSDVAQAFVIRAMSVDTAGLSLAQYLGNDTVLR